MDHLTPIRVVVCGSRRWCDARVMQHVIGALPLGTLVIHGGARGADRLAGYFAAHMGLRVQEVPADWAKHGKAAGPIRNQQMLDMRPDKVIAFMCLPETRGTRDTVDRAEAMEIPVEVYHER